MKGKSHFFWTILISIVALACGSDDDVKLVNEQPAAVSFQADELVVAENGGSKQVVIQLNKKLKQHIEIVIDVQSLTNNVTLIPSPVNGQLSLPIAAEQEVATFSIMPVDNAIINENQEEAMTFVISAVSKGLLAGEKKSLRVLVADDEVPAMANFSEPTASVRENQSDGIPVGINFSHKVPASGELTFYLESTDMVYGRDFATSPEAVNGKLNLSVELGAEQTSFTVIPLDDNLFNGSRSIALTLESAVGGLSPGNINKHKLIITDDELATKAKGYTIGGGFWTYKKDYAYNLDGSLARVSWEQSTPAPTSGSHTYYYDANGNLIKSVDNPVQETHYLWEGNRITKSQRIRNGQLVEYKVYGYDDHGNVGEVSQYNKQPDGNFVMSIMFVYLYHTDGNVYKRMVYYPEDDENDLTLISTQTYDAYMDVENPFTMVEILPNKKSQLTLPLSYREEGNGSTHNYQFTYEFDAQGRPTKRIASGDASEVTNYQYFD